MHIKDHNDAMTFFRTYDSVASKGKWKEFVDEMEFDSMLQEPRNMAHGGRIGYEDGQLVQNTADGSRPGYGGPGSGKHHSQKLKKPEVKRVTSLRPHEVTIFRRIVNSRAEKRDMRLPDWDKFPGRGYSTDYAPGQAMAKGVIRRIKAGKLKTIGTGTGGANIETFLSKADQDKIKKRFGSQHKGEWNFKTKKNIEGRKFGLPRKGNEKLYQKIVNYIAGTHGPNFAFDTFDNANYHLVQMRRAANLKVNPNKNYIPIYKSGSGGIIGYKDLTQNGKEYYHADYTGVDSNGKKALLINKNHPDAPQLNKLINIIEGTKQEYDDILGPLFKKHGFETPSLNQLIDTLLETKGRSDIASSIERHHQYGVGRQPGKIQLVTRDMNKFAQLIEGRIKAEKMDLNLADRLLKSAGVQIVVDGQKIGAPDIAPEKQIKDWKKWARRKTLADPTDFLKQAGFNIDECLSEGGRVSLKFGKGVNSCITGVIEAEQKKAMQGNKISKAKFGKFGKYARTAGLFLGAWDAPIELAFALPHMLQGDKEAAKRATTAGLLGWGEEKLDEVKADSPEAYKYAKHVKDNNDWVDAWFSEQDADQNLEILKDVPEGSQMEKKAIYTDQKNKAIGTMAQIQAEYVGYVDEEGNFDSMAGAEGKTALQDYLREDVEKKSDAGLTITDIPLIGDYNMAPYKGGDPITNIKQYIEQKNEPYWKSGLEHAAEEAGVPDLYDTFMQGADIKDPRDLYSELPLEYASELAALEKQEMLEGLRRKGLYGTVGFKKMLEEQGMDYDELSNFATGGIASLKKKW